MIQNHIIYCKSFQINVISSKITSSQIIHWTTSTPDTSRSAVAYQEVMSCAPWSRSLQLLEDMEVRKSAGANGCNKSTKPLMAESLLATHFLFPQSSWSIKHETQEFLPNISTFFGERMCIFLPKNGTKETSDLWADPLSVLDFLFRCLSKSLGCAVQVHSVPRSATTYEVMILLLSEVGTAENLTRCNNGLKLTVCVYWQLGQTIQTCFISVAWVKCLLRGGWHDWPHKQIEGARPKSTFEVL